MTEANAYLKVLLENLRTARENARLSETALENKLILGPGWINRFESGNTVPSIDMLLAILHETGAPLEQLLRNLPKLQPTQIERAIFAEQSGNDIIINFRYTNFDATYRLCKTTLNDFDTVIKTLRDGLARLAATDQASSEAVKTDSVARCFLTAVKLWPQANPSDLWWFIVYRAYCDPYNHPAKFARLDFTQSWKRTGGWALEEILVRHYAPFLKTKGINLYIADSASKQTLVRGLNIADRIEADKIDVVLTADTPTGPRFFGVVHVKASFAERRTDDVPMSIALSRAGYTSPLWTMDCKSMPSAMPTNRGELGCITVGSRSAKRKDIEDEGYFTGCFSYNKHTLPSTDNLPIERRVYVCDFANPDDLFSRFILKQWHLFASSST